MAKDGLKGGYEAIKVKAKEISDLIMPYPVSIELLNDPKEMFEQAKDFARLIKIS